MSIRHVRKFVALLPMKAHSERVKGKNFRSLAGKPLYRWILETLASLDDVERIVINTDGRRELAETGLSDGDYDGKVMIRDRREDLRGDTVSMNLILQDDIAAVPGSHYLMTHTTNPRLSADSVRAAMRRYLEAVDTREGDSLFTVNHFQTRFYRADGSAVNHDPANLIRTQDLEPWFEENSCLYLFSGESFASCGARIGAKPVMHPISKIEAVDIDVTEDWQIAEALTLYFAGRSA